MPRLIVSVLLALLVSVGTASADAAWVTAPGGDNLVRPAFWEAYANATPNGTTLTLAGSPDGSLSVDRYGPRLRVSGDFGVVASLEAASGDPAMLALVDAVPEDQWGPNMRRVEFGLDNGQVVLDVFDGTSSDPVERQSFASGAGSGPVTVGVYRDSGDISLQIGGAEVARTADPGIFQTGEVLLGSHLAASSQLTLHSLDVQTTSQAAPTVQVGRCTPTRLLAAGSEEETGLWWIWPDNGFMRQIDPGTDSRSYLVAMSPDNRWVLYYATPGPYNPATDRFVVDTWVMDMATDERFKLVESSAPLGWTSDSANVVLGERPTMMARVPSGELVPTQGSLAYPTSMRAVISPDGTLKAAVEATPDGAAGISITNAASGNEVMNIPTGRGAPQLAWSPDSARLAYTSGNDTPAGLLWKLRMVDLASQKVDLLGSTQDMHLHSVLWAPPLPGC
jgi:hypothetical protein